MKQFAMISNRGPDFSAGDRQHASIGGTKDAYAHLMDEFCDSWTCIAPDDLKTESVASRYGNALDVVFVERERYRNYYHKFVSECLYPLLVGWPEKIKSQEHHGDFLEVSKQVAKSAEAHAPHHDFLICDYHLYKIPEYLKGNSRTVFFWYIPFHRTYADTPLVRDVVTSLGKCDDVIFLHQQYAENFVQLHDRLTHGSRLETKVHGITLGPHEHFEETEHITSDHFHLLLKDKFGIERKESGKYMVSIARMDFVKSIPLLLGAFEKFISTPEGSDTDLILVLPPHRPGSELYDKEEETIRLMIDRLPPDRVFVRWSSLQREEIKTLYKFADTFAVPSRHDGMPLTPFEFALSNKGHGDVILSDGVGAHELLHPYSQSFQRDNVESFVETLRIASRSTEYDKHRRMEEMKKISRNITLHQWLARVAATLVTRYPSAHE